MLIKSDGFPTYHLANIVDDHLMEITHVLRSQEWISSGPLHILLYKAFGWTPPAFCHLPMVLGADGHKLSKRHGSTSLIEFREKGYLPEALINYVSLLGWSYDGVKEFFTREELEKLFSLDKLNKAGAVFDYKKLDWFNGQYIRRKNPEALAGNVTEWLQKAMVVATPPTPEQERIINESIPLIQERLTVLSESAHISGFLFSDTVSPAAADLIPKKLDTAQTIQALEALKPVLDQVEKKSDEEMEDVFRQTAEKLGVKLGDLLLPLRVALTGSRVSPPLLGSLRILGPEKTRARVDRAIALLRENV